MASGPGVGVMSAVRVLITSQKGGVGKSTIAANVAAFFAEQRPRERIALIDFDHQATSSAWVTQAPVRNLAVDACDIHRSRGGGAVLQMKKATRHAGADNDLVIADLTWVDVLPADVMLDFDLVVVPTSLSRIEIASTLEFVGRFAPVFNVDRAGHPRLVLLPSRVNDAREYHDVLSQERFPVRFSLATPLPYSLQAQELFGRSYFHRAHDDNLWSAFREVCSELDALIGDVRLRRKTQPVVRTLTAQPRATRAGAGILDRFMAARSAEARPAPVAAKQDDKWFGFLRKRG